MGVYCPAHVVYNSRQQKNCVKTLSFWYFKSVKVFYFSNSKIKSHATFVLTRCAVSLQWLSSIWFSKQLCVVLEQQVGISKRDDEAGN